MGIYEILSNYNEIRDRLKHPPNAVHDPGINLRRNRIPPFYEVPLPRSVPPPVFKYERPRSRQEPVWCKVTIKEVKPIILSIPAPPIEPVKARTVSLTVIERAVCHHFSINSLALHSRSRKHCLVYPRHIFWYLSVMYTGFSLPRIANWKSRRDHTTVLHAKEKIEEMILVDDHTANIVRVLEFVIFGGYYDDNPQSAVAPVPKFNLAEKLPAQGRRSHKRKVPKLA